jgi:hypothetical protein
MRRPKSSVDPEERIESINQLLCKVRVSNRASGHSYLLPREVELTNEAPLSLSGAVDAEQMFACRKRSRCGAERQTLSDGNERDDAGCLLSVHAVVSVTAGFLALEEIQ